MRNLLYRLLADPDPTIFVLLIVLPVLYGLALLWRWVATALGG